jgi:predicted ribosomally synthesized peptide with SipW-like signal peptide
MLRRLFLTGILAIGVLSGFVQGGTLAYLTSRAASAGNQFTAGSVTLEAGIAGGDTLSVSNLVPGDSFVAGLALRNDGTLALSYSMSTTVGAGAALADALLLTVRTETANPCSSLDGAVLYGPGALGAGAFGQSGPSPQPGNRTLAAGADEALCFRVQLPAGAEPSLQGNNTTVTFTFAAVQ